MSRAGVAHLHPLAAESHRGLPNDEANIVYAERTPLDLRREQSVTTSAHKSTNGDNTVDQVSHRARGVCER